MGSDSARRLCLFDVDGTLTLPRKTVEQPMVEALQKLRSGVRGGEREDRNGRPARDALALSPPSTHSRARWGSSAART